MQTTTLKPIFKWPGGKRWLVPHVRQIWADHQDCTFVDAFCGGLGMTLGLNPRYAVINDINPHVINFYRLVNNDISISLKPRNQATTYYRYRQAFNNLIESERFRSEKAANYFYVISKMCYNGLIRFNKSGLFNSPFGQRDTLNIQRDFSEYKPCFAKWTFQEGSYEDLHLPDNSFIFIDPPYDTEFVQYSADGFSWEDQVRVMEWAVAQDAPVILCNQATQRIRKLYKRFGAKIRTMMAPRRISCNGDRRKVREVFATFNI